MNLLKKLSVMGLVAVFSFAMVGMTMAAASDYSNQADCSDAGYYWYDGTEICYETENAKLSAQVSNLMDRIDSLTATIAELSGGSEPQPATGGDVPAVCEGVTFDSALDVGMSGDNVLCLQTMLNQDLDSPIADSGAGSPGNETSYFGSITKGGVATFQENYSEDVLAPWDLTQGTGYVGKTTREKLNGLLDDWAAEEKAAEDYTEQSACEDAGYYWYEEACHESEQGEQVTGEGLQVSLADDNPAAGTIISGTGGGNAQSLVPFLKVKFSNGDDSAVDVTDLNFTRSGISADTDVSQAYLFEEDEKVAEYSSFSSKVLNFNDSSGLFSIPAGESKVVTLKNDIASGTDSGKTIKFSLDSSSDVSSDASEVSGDFVLNGNTMTTANVSDLGQLSVATTGGSPTGTLDPQDNRKVFEFKLSSSNQDMEVRKLVFTNVGSIDNSDLQDFELYHGGTKVAGPVQMASNSTVTYDLSDSPIELTSGDSKTLKLKADIIGGTNRNFKFSFQNMTDIIAYDTSYGVYVKPNQADSWTVVDPDGSATINTGQMTLSKASDTPSGNVSQGGTGVTLAKFEADASGEDVKVTSLKVDEDSSGVPSLDNVKVYLDGTQKGSTQDYTGSAISYSFGNTFIISKDEVSTIKIVSDIKDSSAGDLDATNTIQAKISSMSAKGRDSLASVSVGIVSGYELSVSSGDLTASKNTAQPDWSTSSPTGVKSATDVRVGAFTLSSGSGEGASVSSITLADKNGAFGSLQNVELYKGTMANGTKIGNTQSTVSKGNTYDFYADPDLDLDASEQIVLNVYADILSDATTGPTATKRNIKVNSVSATGKTTSNSLSLSSAATGQRLWIADSGSLSISQDANAPTADIVTASQSDVVFNQVKFDTSTSSEDMKVTELRVGASLGSNAPTSSVTNITVSGPNFSKSVSGLDADGKYTFDMSSNPWVIDAGNIEVLDISADVNIWQNASSGSDVALNLASTTYKGAVSGSATTVNSSVNGNSMYVYKTEIKLSDFSDNSCTPEEQPSNSQKVLCFEVSNLSGYEADFKSATVTSVYTQGDGRATSTDNVIWNIKKVSDDSSVNSVTAVSSGENVLFNTGTSTKIDSLGETIPADGSTKYYLEADTSHVDTGTNASTYTFKIDTATDVTWSDGETTDIVSNHIDTFPVSNTIKY